MKGNGGKVNFELDFRLGDIFDYTESDFIKEKIRKLISEEVGEYTDKKKDLITSELKKQVQKLFETEKFISADDIRDIISSEFKKTILEKIPNLIETYSNRIIGNFSELQEVYQKSLRQDKEKLMKFYETTGCCENVDFMFVKENLSLLLGNKIEEKATYYLKREYGWHVEKFDSWATIDRELSHLKTEHRPKLIAGKPDLIVKDGNVIFFVEVKSQDDGLRCNQALWAKQNPDYKYVVLYLIDKKEIIIENDRKNTN